MEDRQNEESSRMRSNLPTFRQKTEPCGKREGREGREIRKTRQRKTPFRELPFTSTNSFQPAKSICTETVLPPGLDVFLSLIRRVIRGQAGKSSPGRMQDHLGEPGSQGRQREIDLSALLQPDVSYDAAR